MFSTVVEFLVLHPQSAMRHGQSLDQSGQCCHAIFLYKGSVCQKLLSGIQAVLLTFLPLPSQFLSNWGPLRTEWECCKRWTLIVVDGRRNSGGMESYGRSMDKSVCIVHANDSLLFMVWLHIVYMSMFLVCCVTVHTFVCSFPFHLQQSSSRWPQSTTPRPSTSTPTWPPTTATAALPTSRRSAMAWPSVMPTKPWNWTRAMSRYVAVITRHPDRNRCHIMSRIHQTSWRCITFS